MELPDGFAAGRGQAAIRCYDSRCGEARVPINPVLAKYAAIANTLQSRITTGAYGPGSMLPSEAQLVAEFGASRSTVVKALEYLRQLGYIEGVKGKGRIVLGPPPVAALQPPTRIGEALRAAEVGAASLIAAGRAPSSERIAAALAIPVGELVVARQRLMAPDDSDRPTLNTVFVPVGSAGGTAFHAPGLLREGALDHFERRQRHAVTDVVERLSVRPVSKREATLLALKLGTSALVSLLIVRNSTGQPLLVFDLVNPVPPQGLHDVFRLR
ncbi:hypothetical protein GCM10010435_37550 [Winogradskya consettensis]|uniref:HTH gntR-type domain-containing protein n=1 Tax=Winogradskya consettensis TaxID=113560 RepID=A0A919T3Q4_9ACTN|nr:GntR family transcriptional regulator [Actinoplanes consettensis]GIM83848.1 hypothetical protein Aco04nite_88540 [Actinoplanes consettensis]